MNKENIMTESTVIKTSTCDDCGRHGPGTEFLNDGHPVYFVCKGCEPKPFERRARADIDRWLTGGEP